MLNSVYSCLGSGCDVSRKKCYHQDDVITIQPYENMFDPIIRGYCYQEKFSDKENNATYSNLVIKWAPHKMSPLVYLDFSNSFLVQFWP
jgi:hypothetical protein